MGSMQLEWRRTSTPNCAASERGQKCTTFWIWRLEMQKAGFSQLNLALEKSISGCCSMNLPSDKNNCVDETILINTCGDLQQNPELKPVCRRFVLRGERRLFFGENHHHHHHHMDKPHVINNTTQSWQTKWHSCPNLHHQVYQEFVLEHRVLIHIGITRWRGGF